MYESGLNKSRYVFVAKSRALRHIKHTVIHPRPKPNKIEELELLKHSLSGIINKLKPAKVDLFVENAYGEQFLFDLKTAKPNKGDFQKYKQTLLEWAGIAYTANKNAKVHTLIAIPYNPYEPQPYQFWTLAGMLDLQEELMVAERFWDFLGGAGAYNELLDCFEKAGIELRPVRGGHTHSQRQRPAQRA